MEEIKFSISENVVAEFLFRECHEGVYEDQREPGDLDRDQK